MSLSQRFVPLAASLLGVAFLAACGGGGANTIITGTAPPSGGFAAGDLNGTYVFSVSGTDANGAPMAVAGTFTANGNSGVTGGALDINDPSFSPSTAPNLAVSGSSSYHIGADGRGQITLVSSNNPFGGNLIFDFVLQDNAHGLITEFDGNATGSGTLDLQTSGVTPTGTYAYSFSGAAVNISTSTANPWAVVGNFTVASGGAIAGLQDVNSGGVVTANLALSGTLGAVGPSTTPGTTFTTSPSGTPVNETFDVIAIDATHLKFIEMDSSGTLVGDAMAQTTATLPTAPTTYAFVLEGAYPISDLVSAAGGFIVTDGAGNITNASTLDANNGGNGVVSTTSFTGTYTAAGAGRYTIDGLTNFEGTQYVAYPYNAGLFLLEIDNAGIMSGAAYTQTATSFASAQGYALNLTGLNLGQVSLGGGSEEVDDIAEFVSNSNGNTITGVLDENFEPSGGPSPGLPLQNGTYTAPDTNGRGQITTNIGGTSTLNGGFALSFYSVDGKTFPFIETDGNGQAAAGIFLEQSTTASSSATRSHLFVVRPPIKATSFRRKRQ